MPKYVIVVELANRNEYIRFNSFWAANLRLRDLKRLGYNCHLA